MSPAETQRQRAEPIVRDDWKHRTELFVLSPSPNPN